MQFCPSKKGALLEQVHKDGMFVGGFPMKLLACGSEFLRMVTPVSVSH